MLPTDLEFEPCRSALLELSADRFELLRGMGSHTLRRGTRPEGIQRALRLCHLRLTTSS
jgi:hypothetical protein